MNSTLDNLQKCFLHIDATPDGWPAHFEFCVPGSEAFARWPGFPLAARVESGRAAGGRGITKASCRESGLGEAIELASLCAWGDETLLQAPLETVRDIALGSGVLAGLTAKQRDERRSWNSDYGALDWRGRDVADDEVVDWMQAEDLSGAVRLIPAEAVLIGKSVKGDDKAVLIADTCGCAAGADADSARLGAVLELIERDAVGRWWHGARQRAQFGSDIVSHEPALCDFLERRERITRLFDITTDIGVPVVAAVSWTANGGDVAMGFSARFDHAAAAIHAVVEMLQGEIALTQRAEAGDRLLAEWLERATARLPMLSPPLVAAQAETLPQDNDHDRLQACLDRFEALGLDIMFMDFTRAAFGVPVFRAIAPDLCRDKPRWNYARLCAADERDLGVKPDPDENLRPPNRIPLMV